MSKKRIWVLCGILLINNTKGFEYKYNCIAATFLIGFAVHAQSQVNYYKNIEQKIKKSCRPCQDKNKKCKVHETSLDNITDKQEGYQKTCKGSVMWSMLLLYFPLKNLYDNT